MPGHYWVDCQAHIKSAPSQFLAASEEDGGESVSFVAPGLVGKRTCSDNAVDEHGFSCTRPFNVRVRLGGACLIYAECVGNVTAVFSSETRDLTL